MLQRIINEIKASNGVVNKKELVRKLEIDPTTLEGMLMLLHNSGRIKIENVQETLGGCADSCANCQSGCF